MRTKTLAGAGFYFAGWNSVVAIWDFSVGNIGLGMVMVACAIGCLIVGITQISDLEE